MDSDLMLTEDTVIEAVCNYLKVNGYEVRSSATTAQRGHDIEAVKSSPPTTLYIEAKGETSSRESSARYGKPFDAAQCRDHVANAVYATAVDFSTASSRLGGGGTRVALALPETEHHSEYIAKVQVALDVLDIGVFWVSRSQQVRLAAKWQLKDPASGDNDVQGPTTANNGLVAAGRTRELLNESASLSDKASQQKTQKGPEMQMTHEQQIFGAAASLAGADRNDTFTRKEVRERLNLNPETWKSGYTAIFQAMRDDHPGGAPAIGRRFRGVFYRVDRGTYRLTKYGCQLAAQIEGEQSGLEERHPNPA